MKTATTMKEGITAHIVSFDLCPDKLVQKFNQYGIFLNSSISLVHHSIFQDPLAFIIDDCYISLKRADADLIEIK